MTITTMNAMRGRDAVAVPPLTPFRSLTDVALSSISQIYESVPATRETLAMLFAVDAAQTHPTDAWMGFFVTTACEQLIWDERPTGVLTEQDAAWVLARFDEAPSLSILAVMVRLTEEAHRLPSTFVVEVRSRARTFSNGPAERPAPVQDRRSPVSYLRLVA